MAKEYECCICHKIMERDKRLVYQEFDGRKSYGAFHNKANYDICNSCFKIFKKWVLKHRNEKEM